MLILVTGSEGLVGRALSLLLERSGAEVRRFDVRRSPAEDVLDREALAEAVRGADGVVHLAAVSRVVWAQRDPARCEAVNVGALRNLLSLCSARRPAPWVLFASSREVYGDGAGRLIAEDSELRPLNVYAFAKREGERLMREAANAGLVANVCRLSSVYGSPDDHPDRVAMAFALAAARGGAMQLEGPDNAFDFTALEDVAAGLARMVELCRAGDRVEPVHFVSGRGTSLRALAELALAQARRPAWVVEAAPRDFDVAHFVGDPARAASLLGWRAKIDVETGLKRLIGTLAAADDAPVLSEAARGP